MPRYVALLRAINVGGHVVTMPRLRAEFEALGFTDVATYIASGNVLFSVGRAGGTAGGGAPAALERRIARALEEALGYAVAVLLRTSVEMAAAAAFPSGDSAALAGARADPRAGSLAVGFLPRALAGAEQRAVRALGVETDTFAFHARELYWWSTIGQGKAKFSLARLERALGLQATFRSITTVRALAALMR